MRRRARAFHALVDRPWFQWSFLTWCVFWGFLAAIQHQPWLVVFFVVSGVFCTYEIVQRRKEDQW